MKKGLTILLGIGMAMSLARLGSAAIRDGCKAAIAPFDTPDCQIANCPKRLQDKFGPAKFEENAPGKRVAGTITFEKNVRDGKTRVVDVLIDFTCDTSRCVLGCKLD